MDRLLTDRYSETFVARDELGTELPLGTHPNAPYDTNTPTPAVQPQADTGQDVVEIHRAHRRPAPFLLKAVDSSSICPKPACDGYSPESWSPISLKTCKARIQCYGCMQVLTTECGGMAPRWYHKCGTCNHEWDEPEQPKCTLQSGHELEKCSQHSGASSSS
ncbi:hypothetical protein H4Q26_003832 [Puccinia striiformis f. sp. tritici PST-130]|nr:hypothetical protein H4Q26_003832 [Puccinia striiformis f. sp. tritici PST-130]